ncbi:chaperonin 10-like protein [Massariosphaeria phaeospora]|uniref:Chaperonin 10-like protein n=1 Tax=Massariosphaeria phaeospora TaxID=100035 RepID=A0A7C8M8C9_9PLEO|nr:chaperonin 10-like protein [Massariosphaeria phaeospora]
MSSTHPAIATSSLTHLSLIHVATPIPVGPQVLVRVHWTASTPLDLHITDGGLLAEYPQILGDGAAGTVVAVGPDVKRLKVGDRVFGFTFKSQESKAHQEFVLAEEWEWGVVPEGVAMRDAVTLPNNFVTVFHAGTTDLGFGMPWPRPNAYVPNDADALVLIWGGASSVGQYALQILRYYGYTNIAVTASEKHHEKLRGYGAKWTVDYRNSGAVDAVRKIEEKEGKKVRFVLDCIGSLEGSVKPIAQIAKRGARVAVLLPVIVRDVSETEGPVYGMDVQGCAEWAEGVEVRGVRTHFYQNPDIMPTMLREGVVEPNKTRVIEADTMLERARKAMGALRGKEASGERLVWRIAEE